MTNGTVVVLGRTGKNFGAGMSGGIAYVLDAAGDFESRFNPGMVSVRRLTTEDSARVRELVYAHLEATDSERAKAMLADWAAHEGRFWAVVPHPPVESRPAPAPKAAARA